MTSDGETLLATIRSMLELGFPAIVLVMLYALWHEYKKQVNARIEDLREISGLKQRLEVAQALNAGQKETD